MSAILLQQHLVITCYNLTKWPPVFNLSALRPVTSAMPTMQSTTRLPRNIKDSAGLENHQSSFILFEINHILDGWKCNGFQIIIRRLYIYIWETHLYLDEDAPKRMWGTGEPVFLKQKRVDFMVHATGGSTWCPAGSFPARRSPAPPLAAHCAGRPCAPSKGDQLWGELWWQSNQLESVPLPGLLRGLSVGI